jgi:hypothetical protein
MSDTPRTSELERALRLLYEETADYIRTNNLGDVHHNKSMQAARDALAATPRMDEARIVALKYAAMESTKWPHNPGPTDLIKYRNTAIYLARAYLAVSAE